MSFIMFQGSHSWTRRIPVLVCVTYACNLMRETPKMHLTPEVSHSFLTPCLFSFNPFWTYLLPENMGLPYLLLSFDNPLLEPFSIFYFLWTLIFWGMKYWFSIISTSTRLTDTFCHCYLLLSPPFIYSPLLCFIHSVPHCLCNPWFPFPLLLWPCSLLFVCFTSSLSFLTYFLLSVFSLLLSILLLLLLHLFLDRWPAPFEEAQRLPYYATYCSVRLLIHSVCTSHYLDIFITFIICLNVVTMSLEHYNQPTVSEFKGPNSFLDPFLPLPCCSLPFFHKRPASWRETTRCLWTKGKT